MSTQKYMDKIRSYAAKYPYIDSVIFNELDYLLTLPDHFLKLLCAYIDFTEEEPKAKYIGTIRFENEMRQMYYSYIPV